MTTRRTAVAIDTLRAMYALVKTTLLFRVGGREAVARAAQRAMASTATPSGAAEPPWDEVWRMQRAANRALCWAPFPVLCLQRSLVLIDVLSARGHPATLRIGVQREGSFVIAHAWVECAGVALERPALLADFTPFPRPPARDPRSSAPRSAHEGA
jgi:hypothetical protein